MIKRNDKCEYCGKEMTAKSIRKRFCSANCRVYSKREKVYAEKYTPTIEVKSIDIKSAKVEKEEGKPVAKFSVDIEEDLKLDSYSDFDFAIRTISEKSKYSDMLKKLESNRTIDDKRKSLLRTRMEFKLNSKY